MKKKREFITNTLFWALIGAMLLLFFKYLFPALIPFVVAFVVASIVRFLAKKIGGNSDKAKKAVALIITLCFYSIVFGLIILVGVQLVDKISNFIQSIPTIYSEGILPLFQQIFQKVEEITLQFDENVAKEVENSLNEFTASIGKYISNISFAAVKIISDGILSIPSILINLIVTVVATFFFAIDLDIIAEIFKKVLGDKRYDMISEGARYTKDVILAYLKSYTLLFFLTFIELCIGLWILRIPYPIYIALAIAIFDILPILGTGGVLIPWALICLFIGNAPLGIGIFMLYVIITAIRNTVEPRVVGMQIGLHPLITLMAMFVGLQLFGLIGLLGCPVILVIVVNMAKGRAMNNEESET